MNENFHGYGEYYWYNGKVYKGNWVDGKMEGQGTLSFDGKEYIGILNLLTFQVNSKMIRSMGLGNLDGLMVRNI